MRGGEVRVYVRTKVRGGEGEVEGEDESEGR